jgi:hypothetical protein
VPPEIPARLPFYIELTLPPKASLIIDGAVMQKAMKEVARDLAEGSKDFFKKRIRLQKRLHE